MQENAHNTKGMVVDIDHYLIEGKGKVDLIAAIPYLDSIPSWREFKSNDLIGRSQLARYIVYVYSHDSFMWKMQMQLPDIKQRALELSGLLAADPVKHPIIKDVVYWLKGVDVMDMVHDYLRVQNKDLWSEYIICQSQIDEYNKLRLMPNDAEGAPSLKEKRDLREEVDELVKAKQILEKKFYGQYSDAKDAMRKKMITIESRAMNVLDNVETD